MTVPKPLPQVDPGTAPYWEGLREGKFLLKSCRSCGKPHFYPRESCPYCESADLDWRQASGLGEIYSFTVCVRPAGPAFAEEAPYVVAIVTLDEGPRMMTWILGAHAEIVIGKRVRLKAMAVSEAVTLPMFELCE